MPRRYILLSRVLFAAAIGTITFLALTGGAVPIVSTLNDKLQHGTAFFGLALLLDFSFPTRSFGAPKVSALLAYGIVLELAQMGTQHRDPSLWDVAADAAGLVIYAASLPLLRRAPVLQRRWEEERA